MPSPPPSRRPVYEESGRKFHADSCRSLVEAAERGEADFRACGRRGYPGWRLPVAALPGLCSAGYWDSPPRANWGLPDHRNEGLEITWLVNGQCPAAVEGKPLLLDHGDVLVTRPWQPHRIGDPRVGACQLAWIILDLEVRQPHQSWNWPHWVVLAREDLQNLTSCLRENEAPVWPAGEAVASGFRQLMEAVDVGPGATTISRLAVAVNQVLLGLAQWFRHRDPPLRPGLASGERTVRMFLASLPDHPDHEWSLATMARACHMGVTQFTGHFRRLTNETPARWLLRRRLDAAALRLRDEPETSITDIAFDCGFSSSQYFATAFAKQHGLAPRAYRETTGG